MHSALQPLSVPRSFFLFLSLFLLSVYLLIFSTGFSLLTDLSGVDFHPAPSTYATFSPHFLLQLPFLSKPFKIQLQKGEKLHLGRKR